MERKIVQIMPANGWRALFVGKSEDLEQWTDPLVCWALVEDDLTWQGQDIRRKPPTTRHVVGMIAADPVEFCDRFDQFQGYVGPGETEDANNG